MEGGGRREGEEEEEEEEGGEEKLINVIRPLPLLRRAGFGNELIMYNYSTGNITTITIHDVCALDVTFWQDVPEFEDAHQVVYVTVDTLSHSGILSCTCNTTPEMRVGLTVNA